MLTNNGKTYFLPNIRAYQKNNLKAEDGTVTSVSSSYTGETYLYVGNGNTAPTADDYCLESKISTLTLVQESKTHQAANATINYGEAITSDVAVYQNNTSADITVNEIGLFFKDTWYNRYFMIAREVLDSPVIIEPNKSYSFSVTIG